MKIPKQVSTKTFLVSTLAILLIVSGIFYAIAQTPTETFWISSGVYPARLDYIIWREGSNYFVKDNLGAIQSSSSNASTVWQATLDLCANSNGMTVYVKSGTYPLDHGLTVDLRTTGSGNFALIGEPGAILTSNNYLEAGVWSCFLEVYEGEGVTVEGLTFNDGNSGTAYGIHFSGYGATNNTLVEECSFYNFINSSVHYLGMAIRNYLGHDYVVINNYFENCEQGVVCEAVGGNMTHVDISHNTFVGCGHSINCEISTYGGAAITIDSNTITGSDVYTRGLSEAQVGINIFAQSDSSIYHNLAWSVTGNTIRFRPTENATGIRVTKCPAISITGNVICNTHYNQSSGSLYSACGAIQVRGSPGAVVSGNTIYNGTVGIVLFQYTYDPDYMAVTGNTVRSMTGAGYYLHRAMYNVFSGNIAQDCGTWGFQEYFVAQTANNTYIGCHALDCTTGGIYLETHATNDGHVVACWNNTSWIS